MQARFYDAADHRFISEDSAKDGTNWYIYCMDNPLMYVDAEGYEAALAPLSIGDKNDDVSYLNEVSVNKGIKVNKGDTIAKSGNSGGNYKPHLHIEIMMNVPISKEDSFTINEKNNDELIDFTFQYHVDPMKYIPLW